MLKIRPEQMQAFQEAASHQFEEDIIGYLLEYWSRKCEQLGPVRLRESIRHGLRRAQAYGLTSQQDILRYINLMFLLGHDFDRDPRFFWAHSILNDPNLGATEKLDGLSARALREK
jgi:hypothetical protein